MSEIKLTDQEISAARAEPANLDLPKGVEEIGCFSYGVIYVAIGYLATLFIVYTGVVWIVRTSLESLNIGWQWWLTPLLLTIVWGAAAIPILPWLYFWRSGKLQTVAHLWAAGALYLLIQIPFHFIPAGEFFWWQVAQLLLNISLLAVVGFWLRQRDRLPRPAGPYAPLVFLSALFAIPWLIFGAYGAFFDIALTLIVALSFGLLAAVLLVGFGRPGNSLARDVTWDIGTGAHVAGSLLMFMAVGFGSSIFQMVLLFVSGLAGWLFMSLLHWGRDVPARGWLAGGLFLGLMTALPALTFDVAELEVSLAFALTDLWQWLGIALAVFILLAFVFSVTFFLARFRLKNGPGMRSAALVTLLLAFGLWALVGQPGTHGERLFVILKAQADVTAAATPSAIDERRADVYGTLVAHADVTQADIRATLDLLRIDYTPYYLVNALEVDGGPLIRLWLANRPEVDRILDSPRLRPLPTEPIVVAGDLPPPDRLLWNLSMIGADRVWDEFDVHGEGIVIGQSDSGVAWQHPELQRSYRGGENDHDYNWFDPWFGTTVPEDWSGHGTHTLGSILGESVGVAPEASWFGCVNLARNLGNPALYTDCLQFMLAPFPLGGDPWRDGQPALGAHIINNSWGCPAVEGCDPAALQPAVHALRAAGIFVVASAGNSGPGCGTIDTPLPLYDEVFAVGAVGPDGAITDFSSRGPVTVDGSERIKPDLLAPGAEILSSTPEGSYAAYQGTSMAGPHVAGVVALIWSANPKLIGDIDKTTEILHMTASPYESDRHGLAECAASPATPNAAVGYGIVDAYAAVSAALNLED